MVGLPRSSSALHQSRASRLAPFRARQGPFGSGGPEIRILLDRIPPCGEKRVIGLKNATFEIPDDDPDDVGVRLGAGSLLHAVRADCATFGE